jgi:hypothetical protein
MKMNNPKTNNDALKNAFITYSLKPDTPPDTMNFMAIVPGTFNGLMLDLGTM